MRRARRDYAAKRAALVRGAMSFDVSDHRADEAMKMIDREFVDLNELRVATDLEIAELLVVRQQPQNAFAQCRFARATLVHEPRVD